MFYLEVKVSPRQTSALGGAPITGTKILSKRKLAVNEVSHIFKRSDSKNVNFYFKNNNRFFAMIKMMIITIVFRKNPNYLQYLINQPQQFLKI